MALSVRLEPELEALVEQEARRLGVSKSEFVKDSLSRTLGLINPAELLGQVRTGSPSGKSDLSETVSKTMKRKLRAKHSD
ncbi:MAG: ribbon-helix-helix protein, CopG family [Granulosicoccaceae bacterium]